MELVAATLGKINAANQSLNAVVAENPTALDAARAADRLRQQGATLPLLGLPLTVKDSIDVQGMVCTGGSYVRRQAVPNRDATSVARLRAAGAIVVAKTNVPEYSSSYETDNYLFGQTVHPMDSARTPGGSSGGEGALLGADASVVGIGLDGGGSIRVPSHYCGTVGLRPTVGRVPDTGTWPETRETGYRDLMCVGPMARYVEDLALLLPLLSGPDWIDPFAVPAPLADMRTVNLASLRVGYYTHDGLVSVSAETVEAVERSAGILAGYGAQVQQVTPPDLTSATVLFLVSAGADGGIRTRRDLAGSEGKHHAQFQGLLDSFGAALGLTEFFDLQRQLFAFRERFRAFMGAYDILLCPVTPGPAPRHMEPPWGVPREAYGKYEGFNYTHALSLAGLPVAVVPAGTQEGMPIGVQIAAQPYQEHVALAAASAIEAAMHTVLHDTIRTV